MASSTTAALFLFLNLIVFFTPVLTSRNVPAATHPLDHADTPKAMEDQDQPMVCPMDAMKLGVCTNVLDLIGAVIGSPEARPCCSLIDGLSDFDAAICVCAAIKFDVIGIKFDIPLSLHSYVTNKRDRRRKKHEVFSIIRSWPWVIKRTLALAFPYLRVVALSLGAD
ncbi:hypothetical protein H6P81_017467 [Aristolochia fimbriata]|uniref:Hydrophobic seed protein domain-containing protein n=1 Tax=Aristolochia fimbriata TaxID=158543 RepID=A0AAV7DZ21_ARIFI|nr:hypothetical protein H6P81_017467 [Aristolochia fimbriata]